MKKLASKFWAWSLMIGVSPEFINEAVKRCEDFDLIPVRSRERISGKEAALFSVLIPKGVDENGRPNIEVVQEAMEPYGAHFSTPTEVELVGRLEQRGPAQMCPRCPH